MKHKADKTYNNYKFIDGIKFFSFLENRMTLLVCTCETYER